MLLVSEVKEHNLVCPRWWDAALYNVAHQIPMWVNHSYSLTVLDILLDDVVEKCCLSYSGFSHDVYMGYTVRVGKVDRLGSSLKRVVAYQGVAGFVIEF